MNEFIYCLAFLVKRCAVPGLLLIAMPLSHLSAQRPQDNYRSTDFPYQAIVARDGVATFSGPASVHYATDELNQGDIVAVYRHDPNGWCAIQPPEGSFSLIPEAAIEKVSEAVGVLVQDHVQAWVGTRLGSVDKPLWQVKLRKDEEVEILGQASWPSPDGSSTVWFQIAPPAGEFRWVKIEDLQLPNPNTRGVPQMADAKDEAVDQIAQAAFTDVDPTEDRFVQSTAGAADAELDLVNAADKRSQSGFIYRSEEKKIASQRHPETQRSRASGMAAVSVGADRFAPPTPPQPTKPNDRAEVVSSSDSSRSVQPERDDRGIDFHFRPIGKTAKLQSERPISEIARSEKANQQLDDSAMPFGENNRSVKQATFENDVRPNLEQPVRGGWKVAEQRIGQPRRGEGRIARSESVGQIRSRLGGIEDPRDDFQTPKRGRGTHESNENGFADPLSFQWDDDANEPFGEENFRRGNNAAIKKAGSETGSALFQTLSPRLSQLELELTNEILKRPNEWQLGDLQIDVEQIYTQTKDPVERLQAQRILDKLANCRRIRSGYAKSFQADGEKFGTSLSARSRTARSFPVGNGGLAAARSRLGAMNENRYSNSVAVGTGVNSDFELGTRYDAHGWLTELVSSDRNNRPVYVLVNDEGKITHHVAASPGLNLHRYLKAKVGVNGRQGFNNVLKLSHVTADSVSELIRR